MEVKRPAIEAALRADPAQRDEVIAAALGCSWRWVRVVRGLMYAAGAIPKQRGPRTQALRADPELLTAPPSVLAERHGLPRPYVTRVLVAARRRR